MKATKLLGRRISEKSEKIWNLEEINKRYKEILNMVEETGDGKDKGVRIKKIWKSYLEILRDDPILPREFLPDNWKQKEAKSALGNFK